MSYLDKCKLLSLTWNEALPRVSRLLGAVGMGTWSGGILLYCKTYRAIYAYRQSI